jgi:fructosamine-3-kinase
MDQVIGEGESLKAMRKAFPSTAETLVPRVYASGRDSTSGKAYLVTDWLNMTPRLRKKAQRLLGKRLACMHRNGSSPNSKFGFHVPTHCGATVSS